MIASLFDAMISRCTKNFRTTNKVALQNCVHLLRQDLTQVQRKKVMRHFKTLRFSAKHQNHQQLRRYRTLSNKASGFVKINTSYVLKGVRGKDSDTYKTTFNALREINQKRVCRDPIIRHMKEECLMTSSGTKQWKCPHCASQVRRLTAAHTGETAASIIRRVMDKYFETKTFSQLDDLVRAEHEKISFVVCCDACNNRVESLTNV